MREVGTTGPGPEELQKPRTWLFQGAGPVEGFKEGGGNGGCDLEESLALAGRLFGRSKAA